jgi:hypothetical protein
MFRNTALLACALLAGVALPAFGRADAAASATAIDAAARARLIGEHTLSLQWIDWGDLDKAGRVSIEQRGDVLTLEGSEEAGDDRLDIIGRIVAATPDGFTFVGDITIKVHGIAGGDACTRSGTAHFKTSGKRKYWRLQEMQNPCDSATDYVDIYFLGV